MQSERIVLPEKTLRKTNTPLRVVKKNQEHHNIAPLSLQLRSEKTKKNSQAKIKILHKKTNDYNDCLNLRSREI